LPRFKPIWSIGARLAGGGSASLSVARKVL
jgi:hypothetical protein